ncbi:MAG: helix-turn-helix transcriptional regulator [Deltaproteobacteria bacterium]|nr:helix-turn-helix transcriptional regulator [Deltaproteobacteria bacterium]
MPQREIVTQELASLFGALSHPHRVRIIEELGQSEQDVNHLAEILKCSHSRVSQHLKQLKAHRLVTPRREGRHVYYSLAEPRVARWVLEGLDFTEAALLQPGRIRAAMASARDEWGEK